jgi:hypothetical protein
MPAKFKQIYVPIDHIDLEISHTANGFAGLVSHRKTTKAEFHLSCGHSKRAPYQVDRIPKTMRCEFCEEEKYGYTNI